MTNTDQKKTQIKHNGDITSGDHLSLWHESAPETLAFSPLSEDISTDVLVIGGGIAGLTTAYCLAKEGLNVVLVEDGYLCSGETGRTTAHLTCALNVRYAEVEQTFDLQTAQLTAESHIAAINWIEQTVVQNNLECHFKRVDGYLFTHPSDSPTSLQEEHKATQRAGIPTELLDFVPSIHTTDEKMCLKYPNQAQFHILLYAKGLSEAILQYGGKIYTKTKAENITKTGATGNGYDITAKHIVVATNSPINDWVTMHTKQWPYRTYVIAAKIPKGIIPFNLWWDTGDHHSKWNSKPYHYIRLEEFNDHYDFIISGGEDHRTGQADEEELNEEDRYKKLEEWTKSHFPAMEEITSKWSGQVLEPIDSIAYLGRNPGDENIYIITGHSGNGMTYSTIGALVITDLIMGRKNPWEKIYDPGRLTLNATADYVKEAANMLVQYGDWFTQQDKTTVDDLKAGEGAILHSGLKKYAVYKNDENKLHICTAVCPHMGGILQWNSDEKSFDCPMHGSRFTTEGKVINGPASTDLNRVDVKIKPA